MHLVIDMIIPSAKNKLMTNTLSIINGHGDGSLHLKRLIVDALRA